MSLLFISLAALASFQGLLAQPTCPAGYDLQFGASCYQIVGDDGGEPPAAAHGAITCPNGGRLAEINSMAENTFLQGAIDTAGVSAWFGYDSVGHGDGNWRLSSSNAVSPFANWGVGGVPSTAGQACAMLASGSTNFIDADCAGVFNSICEFSLAEITCDVPNNQIGITVDPSLLSAFGVASVGDLHMGITAGSPCDLTVDGNGDFIASFSPNDCGTNFGYTTLAPDAVVLSVSLYHTPSTPSTITRGRGELVAFDCRVQTVDLLSSGEINPEALLAQLTQVGFGDFNVGIEFRNSDFSAAITQSPLAVTLGQNVQVQIGITSAIQDQLDISVLDCFAAPENSRTAVQQEPLIVTDCPNALGNGQAVLGTPAPAAGDDHLFRFRFPAFEFINAAGQRENSVFILCQTRVCLKSVSGNACDTPACTVTVSGKRKRRELLARLRRQTPAPLPLGASPQNQQVALGPFQLVDTAARDASSSGTVVRPTFYGMLLSMGMLYLAL